MPSSDSHSRMPLFPLCSNCRRITAESLASKEGFQHLARFSAHSSDACELCSKLRSSLHFEGALRGDEKYISNLRLKLDRRTRDNTRGWAGIQAIYDNSSGPETMQLGSIYVLTPIGDPAAQQYNIPVYNNRLSSTDSPETTAFIRECLQECVDQHSCDQPLIPGKNSRQSGYPARLIHITEKEKLGNPDHVTLRLVDVEMSCPQYATLSHCWGTTITDEHKTMVGNLADRKKSITWSKLPPNSRDGIEIACRLGISFIWIDALCIIQDSDEDWASESVKMGYIYENSYLTIAAGLGADSFSGCYNKQSSIHIDYSSSYGGRNGDRLIEITGRLGGSAGEQSTISFLCELNRTNPTPLLLSPLARRGWVFQERVLSPRTVHFTPQQVIWECRENYRMEDLTPHPPPGLDGRTLAALVRPGDNPHRENLYEHWYRKIAAIHYGGRHFTKPGDRLIAIAGVARVFKHHFTLNDGYLAGLWETELAIGLGWVCSDNEHEEFPDRAAKTKVPSLPSWTWCCHDGRLNWWSLYEPDREFAFIQSSLQFIGGGSDQFGLVNGGYIQVRGRLIDLAVPDMSDHPKYERSKLRVNALLDLQHPAWVLLDCHHFRDYKDHKLANFKALVLGYNNEYHWNTYFLVIESFGADNSAYVRCGFGAIEVEKWDMERESVRMRMLQNGELGEVETISLF